MIRSKPYSSAASDIANEEDFVILINLSARYI
jgi:hypothetical protein